MGHVENEREQDHFNAGASIFTAVAILYNRLGTKAWLILAECIDEVAQLLAIAKNQRCAHGILVERVVPVDSWKETVRSTQPRSCFGHRSDVSTRSLKFRYVMCENV